MKSRRRWRGCAPMRASISSCATWRTISPALVRALAAERIAVPVVACGTDTDPDAAAHAIRAGAREFLPLPPDPDLIAAILEAASGESHALDFPRPDHGRHRTPRRAGGAVRGVRADFGRKRHRQGGAGAPSSIAAPAAPPGPSSR